MRKEDPRTMTEESSDITADEPLPRTAATGADPRGGATLEPPQPPDHQETADYLDEIHDKEANNFEVSRGIIGPNGLALVEEFRRLYKVLAEREASADLPEQDEISVTHFLVEAESRLILAVLSIFRLHCSDAAVHTRRAIEAAGFLVAIRKDKPLFTTWLNARDDAARYKEYRDAFRTGSVLNAKSGDPLVRHLRKLYDRCSVLSHPTTSSFAGRVRSVETAETQQSAVFSFFDVPPDGGLQMASSFASTLEAHLAILGLLTQSYLDDLRLAEFGWSEQCAQLEARVHALRRSLKE